MCAIIDRQVTIRSMIGALSPSGTTPLSVENDNPTDESHWMQLLESRRRVLMVYVRTTACTPSDAIDLFADIRSIAWLRRAELLRSPQPTEFLIKIAREVCREWVGRWRWEAPLSLDGDLAFANHDTGADISYDLEPKHEAALEPPVSG
jgi:DNA-directed RNA polymerase specialized sigma24 family protein